MSEAECFKQELATPGNVRSSTDDQSR